MSEALEAVAAAQGRRIAAERELRDAVDRARAERESWERIGQALGVTKQTAWEKFGPYATR
jgi:hypothetical protein